MTRPTDLRIDTTALLRNLLIFCVSIEMLLFTFDYYLNYAGGSHSSALRRLFSTSREDGLAGWVAVLQTAMIAVTLWAIYMVVRKTATRWQILGWQALLVFFCYLALDDGAHIHERLGTAYNEAGDGFALGAWTLELFPSYRWQIVFMPLFAAMGFFMFGFLLKQLRGWKPKAAVFVALSCLAGAVVLDFFEGLAPTHALNPYTAITQRWHLEYWAARTSDVSAYDMLLHFSKSIEECTEMFGMTLLWVVFLHHFTWLARDLRVRFDPPQPRRAAAPDHGVAAVAQSPDLMPASELPRAA